jgi:hypothetical protein
LRRSLPANKINNEFVSIDIDSGVSEKVLGLAWNYETDELFYRLDFSRVKPDVLSGKRIPTKREVLQLLMSIFDPMGILSNYTIHGKLIMQAVFRQKGDWDDTISAESYALWRRWYDNIQKIKTLSIPRCYSLNMKDYQVELHVFVDASESAFSAVAYFRFVDKDKKTKVTLVAAKTKVAPKKLLTIPRLELQAAVLGSRLATSIVNGHSYPIYRKTFWSDSAVVLQWINSDARNYKVFVSHRISEILETTDSKEWKWIPTSQNVADEATKWIKFTEEHLNSRWQCGPSFLVKEEPNWPSRKSKHEECLVELRQVSVHQLEKGHAIIDPQRFSNWWKLLRSVARAIRFAWNCLAKKNNVVRRYGILMVEELFEAERIIFCQAQKDSYREEIELLIRDKPIPKNSPLFTLSPYLQNGILRIRGRIDLAPFVSEDMKRPIILPRNNRITELLAMSYHHRFHHHAHETVVNELRQRFYISHIRILVKSMCKKCQLCRIRGSMPAPPEMAPLPYQRIKPFGKAFLYTGVDLFGPFEVTIGRRKEKRWGAIFTCLVVRAVHIEMVYNLTADSFLMVLRNFLNRRGKVIELWSDNATNFTRANKELQTALKEFSDKEEINAQLANNGISWRFITPGAPHHGGAWERMVKSAKKVISALLVTRAPKPHVLESFFIEAENIINARPLTHVAVDADSPGALTPNHFIMKDANDLPAPIETANHDELGPKQWRFVQLLADHYWKRWVKEYLPDLTRRTKWHQKVKPLKVGDLVIVVDAAAPRNTWKRGMITEVVEGKDGQVRSAFVKTNSGIFKRSATKLAVLDVQPEEDASANL